MNSKSMMLVFGVAGVLSLPLLCMFFLLFFFAPVGGIGGGTAACQSSDTTDVGAQTSGKGTTTDGGGIGGFELPKPDGPRSQTKGAGPIPSDYLAAYKAAGAKYGVPWQLLAGIGNAESTHGQDNGAGIHSGQNFAGAMGPMQFLQGTWNSYGVDGNGDGVKNVYDIADAAFATANYLVASGVKKGPQGVWDALWAYNRSKPYANDVLTYAWAYATGKVVVVPGGGGGQCSTVDASTVGGKIVQYAQKWLGTPYQFAGGDFHGPTVGVDSRGDGKLGFDCSGLTMYAVYNATGGKIALDHYVPYQYDDHRIQHVSMDQLQPGDLVFLDDLGHVGIYVGDQKIIDAPQTGEYVRYDSLAPGSYFYQNFVAGGRVLVGSKQQ